jgi:hypothetical protein
MHEPGAAVLDTLTRGVNLPPIVTVTNTGSDDDREEISSIVI